MTIGECITFAFGIVAGAVGVLGYMRAVRHA